MQAFDDEEEEKDACAGPWKEGKDGEYEKSVCEAWKAHHEKVAAHKKKFDGIVQKHSAQGLMQYSTPPLDDEPRDCSDVKGADNKKECESWKKFDERVINHHTKFPSLANRMAQEDPVEVRKCDGSGDPAENRECVAW